MNQEYEQRLAERLHRELRQLPPLKAPTTLLLRVRAAIAARAHRPWWKRSWAHWPPTLKVLFLAVSLILAGAFVYVGLQFSSELSLSSVADKLIGWLSFLTPVWDLMAALGKALVLLARSGGQLFLWSAVAVGGLTYLACVGLGTLCYRVAVNKI